MAPGDGSFSSTSRRLVVVVDDDDGSRDAVCRSLRTVGYDVMGVASPLGLQRAYRQGTRTPALIACDVSPPISFDVVVERVDSLRHAAEGQWPVAIYGSQSRSHLSILARACRAVGFMSRGEDPEAVPRGVAQLLPLRRAEIVTESWGHAQRPESPAPARPRSDWTLTKLLLIDDSEITLQLMQARLRRAGFDVRIAVALGELRSILRGWSPNVIVADVHMPEMRGDELCSRLKATVAGGDVIVLLCSSLAEGELRAIAEAAGADGFVSKELGLDHFVDRIHAYCQRFSDPILSIQ